MILGDAQASDSEIAELARVLGRLRTVRSVDGLLDRASIELGSLGFTRTLVSRVDNGTWMPERAFARGDPDLAQALVAAGRARPRVLDRALVETEMLRRRRPMLVADPRTSPRTHRELVRLVDTEAYVAAPVLVHGVAAVFVHADKNADAGLVRPVDRYLVGAFAEGLGLALEAAIAAARLHQLRGEIAAGLRGISSLVDTFPESASELTLESGASSVPEPAPERTVVVAPTRLSTRERDVLRSMADGKTNAQVASALFVSETTVKYHVGNILRKLGASNRAEAVARFYRTRPID